MEDSMPIAIVSGSIAVVGMLFTQFFNHLGINKHYKKEKELREEERESLKREATLKAYSEILKVINMLNIYYVELSEVNPNEGIEKIKVAEYEKHIKEILFSNYHLLNDKMRALVKEINEEINYYNVPNEVLESFEIRDYEKRDNAIGEAYKKLIEEIEKQYK